METSAEGSSGVYLALGDSLAVGVGAADPSRGGYVGRLFEALRGDADAGIGHLVNLAVSGETSESLISGGQLERGLRAIADLGGAVRLVTLDIGGNDLLWLAATEPCSSAPDSEACRRAVRGTLDRFEGNYRAIVRRIVEAVHRAGSVGARVMAVTYYNPFSGTGHPLELAGDEALLGVDRTMDCRAAAAAPENRGINDVIACVAAEFGADTADTRPRFVGRAYELTLIGYGDVHPNDAGYAVMAEALADLHARGHGAG